jgi:hypothetical protein
MLDFIVSEHFTIYMIEVLVSGYMPQILYIEYRYYLLDAGQLDWPNSWRDKPGHGAD